jgi:hypothetical protein
VVEAEHCHVGHGHAHVQQNSPGCRGLGPRKFWYAPFVILTFALLGICICLVEYDVSFA